MADFKQHVAALCAEGTVLYVRTVDGNLHEGKIIEAQSDYIIVAAAAKAKIHIPFSGIAFIETK
jgi:hypothetical protein